MSDFPRLGLGTSRNTDPEACANAVSSALEAGYRHVDTAQMYGNEAYVGRGVANADVAREDVHLATKVDSGDLGADDVRPSAEASLDRLGVDYVDLLYVHWPIGDYDPETTLPVFDDLLDDGVTRAVGVSNFTPELLEEAAAVLDAPIVAHQFEMHPLLQQEELRAYARDAGHRVVAYCPVARRRVEDVPEIVEVAAERDATPYQVSLAWLFAKGVTPIPKATSKAHIVENYGALDLDLTDADVERIDAIEREERVIDRDAAPWNHRG